MVTLKPGHKYTLDPKTVDLDKGTVQIKEIPLIPVQIYNKKTGELVYEGTIPGFTEGLPKIPKDFIKEHNLSEGEYVISYTEEIKPYKPKDDDGEVVISIWGNKEGEPDISPGGPVR